MSSAVPKSHRRTGSRSPREWRARWLRTVYFLVVLLVGHVALAVDTGQPKNILGLYSFSDSGLFDPVDNLKAAIRSRVKPPVNFYVHYMESQGFEDPGYEERVSESLRYEFRGVKLNVVIAAAYPALRFAVAHRDQVDRT